MGALALSAPAVAGAVAPSGPAGGDLVGTYPNPTIAAGKVTTDKLANFSVTAQKVAFHGLGGESIAFRSIGAWNIEAQSLGADELAPNAVGTSELQNGAITGEDLAVDSVGARALAVRTVPFTLPGPVPKDWCTDFNIPLPGVTPDQTPFVDIIANGASLSVGQAIAQTNKLRVFFCAHTGPFGNVEPGVHLTLRILLA